MPANLPNPARERRRLRLPDRRAAERFPVEHDGQTYLVTLGYYGDGRLGEIFLDSDKPNSAIATHAADAAILCSMLLQSGVAAAEIRHSISGPLAKALDMIGGAA